MRQRGRVDAAEAAGDHIDGMSLRDVLARMASLADAPWVREAVREASLQRVEDLGVVILAGPDGATPWPARKVRLVREPMRGGQVRRVITLVYTLDERGRELVRWASRGPCAAASDAAR